MRAAILLLGMLCGCAASDRMVRAVPFSSRGDLPDAERVNVWPLYYQTGDLVTVLWPLFDRDDQGFALRPLVARDGTEWSVLYPLAAWNTDSGDWWMLPAYRFRGNRGLLPLVNLGNWNHVGPLWWVRGGGGDGDEVSDWGLFPLFAVGEVHHVGPVWWSSGERDDEGSGAWGVFPLAYFDQRAGYVFPAWWIQDEEGDLEQLGVVPLFHYQDEQGYRRLITPLGGRSWGGDGDRRFTNVLGPVFHHSRSGDRRYTAVAWPLFVHEREGERTEVRLFPLFQHRRDQDERSLSMLAGLVRHARKQEGRSLRVTPLFSHNVGLPPSLWDAFTLYGYRRSAPAGDAAQDGEATSDVSFHVGTPLVFHYRRDGGRTEWGSLLNVLDYEAEGDESSFSFLYYLYRQQRRGEQVRRDVFPFFTWDSGPERSGFSFLWRLLRYERSGDRVRGHFLFVPWGDHSEPISVRGTATRPRAASAAPRVAPREDRRARPRAPVRASGLA